MDLTRNQASDVFPVVRASRTNSTGQQRQMYNNDLYICVQEKSENYWGGIPIVQNKGQASQYNGIIGRKCLSGTSLYAYFFGKTRERRYTVWRIARS